jgi:hypothetical protein
MRCLRPAPAIGGQTAMLSCIGRRSRMALVPRSRATNSRPHCRKRHAKSASLRGCFKASAGCDVSTIDRSLLQFGLQLVPSGNALQGHCLRRTRLARRLRVLATQASGTLGSFSPPMNRVR